MSSLLQRTSLAAAFLSLAACQSGAEAEAPAQSALAQGKLVADAATPRFAVDPAWPVLPVDWVVGQVSGLSVDKDGNIWLLQRPNSVRNPPEGKTAAPPVLKFTPEGELLAAWGGPEHAPEIDGVNQWPANVHGLHVDDQGQVWIGGNGRGDHAVLAFTPEGKFVRQVGRHGATGGNLDKATLGGPADIFRHGDELLIADGYTNRRVIAVDADDGTFRHYWGAYGSVPDAPSRQGDFNQSMAASGGDGGANTSAPTFGDIVHCVEESANGDIYVCDRRNNRIQMFRRDAAGAISFVKEILIAPETGGLRTASDVAFSPDEAFMYVADMQNDRVWILRRADHEILGWFGSEGPEPGQFRWLHSVATDKAGNVYTTETGPGRRAQKFVLTSID